MATPTPIYRYPLDPTGVSPDNLVVGEEHQLSNRAVRCVAPTYGGFFAESVLVTDVATNKPLVRGVDYIFGELFEFPTGRYGKEIFGLIAVTKPGVAKIKINYQALGGDYSYSMDSIIAMFDNLNLGDRPVEWSSIINRPVVFDPASHLHDIGDVYGFEYVVHAIERLRSAVLTGDAASHDEIFRYIDKTAQEGATVANGVAADLAQHKVDTGNPHATTKDQLGLGSVQNYGVATQAQMDAGTATNVYLTPNTVAKYVADRAVTPLNTHVARTDNPHSTTKAQVGLGSVDNYPTATDAIALSGVSTAHFVTPANMAYVIQQKAGNALEAHIADKNNPHATTKAQVGLSNVLNYGVATQTDMDTGLSNAVYLTPVTVAKYVTDRAVAPLNTHITDKNNPHATTKAQIGLGNVDNFATATDAIALAGTSTTNFVTPANMAYVIDQRAGSLLNAHIADKNNPHGTTKAQVGLGSVDNYPTATSAEMTAGLATNRFATPSGVRDAITAMYNAGSFDGRYVRLDTGVRGSIHIREDLNTAYIWVNGAWRQFWPPLWQ